MPPVSMEGRILKLELGCGPSKTDGFTGMDLFDYEGVDIVHDMDSYPWPIDDGSCSEIKAIHLIEHIRDIRGFFCEITRIAAPNCRIVIVTPHFSSWSSWVDPTHIHHLSVFFADTFMEGYLSSQVRGLSVSHRRICFGSFIWTWPGRFINKLLGMRFYERRFAWVFPASSIEVILERTP